MKYALTVTVDTIDISFRLWCNYHRRLFDLLIVWIDNPLDLEDAITLKAIDVFVFLGNQSEGPHAKGVQGRAMLRQDINTGNALHFCRSQKIDWLCHLDSDELLFATRTKLRLLWQSNDEQFHFRNYEVFPCWSTSNYFRDCTVFKVPGRHPFNFYGNGKAAVRVNAALGVASAHRFDTNQQPSERVGSICVLHYSCATLDLWLKKYLNLGDFSDYWWDDVNYPIRMPYHLQSRNCLKRCIEIGSLGPALEAWAKQVIAEPELERLIEEGQAIRITPSLPTQPRQGGGSTARRIPPPIGGGIRLFIECFLG
jgi:hypothetical protein